MSTVNSPPAPASCAGTEAGDSPPVPPRILPPKRVPRLRALDGLRLIAALMVAAYHYGGRGGEVTGAWGSSARLQFPTLHTWFAYGCLGVQVFFVISGFVICMSGWGRTLRSFFASRASRLLPSYWAAVVLVTAVFALPVVAYEAVSPSDALVNLTLMQQPLGADRVLGVCWTLWAEVRFYALFALCVVLPGATRQRVILFCAGWTLAAAIAQAAHEPLLDLVLMPQYAPFFIGGIGLYLVHRDRRDAYAWGVVGVSWLIGQHYAVAELWHAPDPRFFSYRTSAGIILVVTLGFLAVAAIALGRLNRADWPWLTVAGALTYPFYLVHEHLGWVAIRAYHQGLGIPSYATAPLTVVTMLVLAWLLNHYVEDRLAPRLRSALSRPREASPASPTR
ncbi:peptidoglycan/LPS O-acetylase OafA/YrhL [Streptomyces sp. V3I8]|uniref:acyltransferase family protein n=1 Tax=Streptomyces sp. V3I8 TaxID=3042279 RepID=UPI0027811546|nr:acyltransferase [Streptomyces sp. V3I8]MDQ1036560.1 peptidoglycan/LPS O-acetylase OafA/YrhL [Streptomyces sp. V3I8]